FTGNSNRQGPEAAPGLYCITAFPEEGYRRIVSDLPKPDTVGRFPMEAADTQDLVFELDDRVATLTFNPPDRLNALSDALIGAALAALRRCATDPDVGVVLVTGAGRAFCAGGDVSAMGAAGDARRTFEDHVDRQHEMHELSWLLATIPKVTIAAVNGAAAGAGLGIALSCDLCFASDRARFGTAFAKVG